MNLKGHFCILQTHFALVYPSFEVAGAFQQVLTGFVSAPHPKAKTFVIEHHTDVYAVREKEKVIGTYESLDHLITGTEWVMTNCAITSCPYPVVHAAALCNANAVVILPGGSGAGKTTLALSLALCGWQLLSDELVPIDLSTNQAHPFLRILCVKTPTLDDFAPIDGQNLLQNPALTKTINNTLTLAPSHLPCATPNTGYPISHIIFPQYRPGHPPQISPLLHSDALVKLIACLSNRQRLTQQHFNQLAHLVQTVPCATLSSGELIQTVETLRAFVS